MLYECHGNSIFTINAVLSESHWEGFSMCFGIGVLQMCSRSYLPRETTRSRPLSCMSQPSGRLLVTEFYTRCRLGDGSRLRHDSPSRIHSKEMEHAIFGGLAKYDDLKRRQAKLKDKIGMLEEGLLSFHQHIHNCKAEVAQLDQLIDEIRQVSVSYSYPA